MHSPRDDIDAGHVVMPEPQETGPAPDPDTPVPVTAWIGGEPYEAKPSDVAVAAANPAEWAYRRLSKLIEDYE
jgi:hypothetical protein